MKRTWRRWPPTLSARVRESIFFWRRSTGARVRAVRSRFPSKPLRMRRSNRGWTSSSAITPIILQGIEVYRGRPVFYALGNFVLDHDHPMFMPTARESICLKLTLKGGALSRVAIAPVLIEEDGSPRILAAEKPKSAEILSTLESLSKNWERGWKFHEARGCSRCERESCASRWSVSGRTAMELNGKIFVITGAARGIGADAARRFSGMGAKVAAVDVDEEGLRRLEAESPGAIFGVKGTSLMKRASRTLSTRWWRSSAAWTF